MYTEKKEKYKKIKDEMKRLRSYIAVDPSASVFFISVLDFACLLANGRSDGLARIGFPNFKGLCGDQSEDFIY